MRGMQHGCPPRLLRPTPTKSHVGAALGAQVLDLRRMLRMLEIICKEVFNLEWYGERRCSPSGTGRGRTFGKRDAHPALRKRQLTMRKS